MDEFISIVDSKPEHEIPKQAVKQSKILFVKGLVFGAGIALCIGGIIQFLIKTFDHKYIQYGIYIWFNINEWTWIIGFIILMFLLIKNIVKGS